MDESPPMAHSQSQPDDHPAIQDFLLWIKAPTTMRPGCGGSNNDVVCNFISWKTLEQKLTKWKVEELLEALFKDREYSQPEADYITKHYLRPFAILLCIGQGRMIHHFSEHQSLQDHLLPFSMEPASFPKSTERNIFADFRREQWAFCAVKLEYNIRFHLETEHILPITHIDRIEEGGSAVTYKIKVDADYDDLVPVTEERLESHEEHRNTYVIKTYRSREAHIYFKTERDAFEKLKYNGYPPSSIIGYYGSFVREETYNIILEYANLGTLDDYMEGTIPPSSAEDKLRFWESFFDVGHGLVTIHGEDEHGGDVPQILLGWHQDVNPTNILVKSHKGKSCYDCQFKLADLGLSHFKKHASPLRDATDVDTWGSTAYGAPETRRADVNILKSRLKVKQDVDIWSMGCVYSEVATWVDQGWNKVSEYRRRRSAEMKEKTGTSEDCFHDGYAVLEAVRQIHHDIVINHRPNDLVTPNVVNSLVNEMLQVRDARPDARFLYDKSKRIIKDAHTKLGKAPSYPALSTSIRRPPMEPVSPTPGSRQVSGENHGAVGPRPDARALNSAPVFSNTVSGRGLSSAPGGDGARYEALEGQPEHSHQHSLSDTRVPYQNLGQLSSQNNFHNFDHNGGHPYQGHYQTDASQPDPKQPSESLIQPFSRAGTGTWHAMNTDKNRDAFDPIGMQQQLSPLSTHLGSATGADGVQPGVAGQTTSEPKAAAPSSQENNDFARRRNEIALSASDPPYMTVEEGLEVKKQREHGKKVSFPPEDKDLFEGLRLRDHAILIDDSQSMQTYRPQVRKVLELLSYMLGPMDPDGLDIYFTTIPRKLKPGNCYDILAEFDKRTAKGLSDMRQRFANILEEYQKKFGKWNFRAKMRHPNSTPSKGPRKLTLYVLTDGVWQQNITLVEEMKTLVKHMTDHNIANKHIGIQFIRFGNDPTGMRRLKKLDSKRRLRVDLDLVDTTQADGNVWKMLLGPINPWFDGDTEDEDLDDEEGLGITVSASLKNKSQRQKSAFQGDTAIPSP